MKLPLFISGSVFLAFSANAYAQELPLDAANKDVNLPPIVVEGAPAAKAKPRTPRTKAEASPPPAQKSEGGSDAEAKPGDEAGVGENETSATATTQMTAQQLADWRVQRVDSLMQAVPNANLSGFGEGRSTLVTFRGIGPLTDAFAPDDNTVVIYIDGVPQLLFAGDASLFDLARVDVFKGPQGTRFGLNTTGGAINFTSRTATAVPGAELRTEANGQGYVLTDVAASKANPSGTASARVALRYSDIDGFVPNVATGNDVGERRIAAGRGTLQFKPSSDTKLTISVRAENDDRTFPYFVLRDEADFPIAQQAIDGNVNRTQAGGSIIVERKLDSARFTSLSGFSDLSTHTLVDDTDGFLFGRVTGLPPTVFAADGTLTDWQEKQQLWTQELRWASLNDDPVDWVAGIFLLHNRFAADYANTHALFPVNNGTRLNDLETTSVAAYGEATIPVGPATRFTGGIRINHDEKSYASRFDGIGFPGTVASFAESGRLDYTYVTGRVSIAHDLTPEDTVVATASRGEKSGGFPRLVSNAALGIPTSPYKSTEIMAYEAGYRRSLMAGTAESYASVFFNDVKDEQFYVFDAGTFSFNPDNIDTQSYGVEWQLNWRMASALSFSGGLGVTIAEIKNVSPQQRAMGAEDGNRPTNTPDVTAFARIDYRQKISQLGLGPDASLIANVGWSYIGQRAATVANDFFLNELHLIDARIGVSILENCELYAFGRNLLDLTPEQSANYVAGAEAVVPDRGRVTGIGLRTVW